MSNIKFRRLIGLLLSSLAVFLLFLSTTANASKKVYRDKHDNATVMVNKKNGKVTSVVYQLKNTSKYKKHYQKRSKFYTKATIVNNTTAKLVRKNYKGVVTFNSNMDYSESKKYVTVQTNPLRGEVGDGTDGIFMNVTYFGKNASKYHNALISFSYWWNNLGDIPESNPEGSVVVFKNGKVSFSDSLYNKLPD